LVQASKKGTSMEQRQQGSYKMKASWCGTAVGMPFGIFTGRGESRGPDTFPDPAVNSAAMIYGLGVYGFMA
jgi:hypothetical protein